MDCFKQDGVDNAELVSRMVRCQSDFFDAYMGLSEPIREWFNMSYSHDGMPMAVMVVHVATAVDCLAELLGVDD